jgi:hypothetical protein
LGKEYRNEGDIGTQLCNINVRASLPALIEACLILDTHTRTRGLYDRRQRLTTMTIAINYAIVFIEQSSDPARVDFCARIPMRLQ